MLKITTPFHGAVLNHRHGQPSESGLQIEVKGEADLRDRVTVNGGETERMGKSFRFPLNLAQAETDITAVAEGPGGRKEHKVRVVWDRNSRPRYRFSIDDNSFFLRDVASRKYRSLFDCFYLAGLRNLHREYGAKFVLNCYYTTGDDFSLPAFPDVYRGEWRDNANWLKLSFHAWADAPARPYQYASGEKLASDFDKVAEEILRFAGEETWSPPTVIHWGMVLPSALPTLSERGVRALSGYFSKVAGHYDVNYWLDDERSSYLAGHDALKDFDSGIVFSKVDIVCNNTAVHRVVPTLDPLTRDPDRAEIMDLFTHEQYFWDFCPHYRPDHFDRLNAAIRFCTERGYEPVFFHEGLLGAPPSIPPPSS